MFSLYLTVLCWVTVCTYMYIEQAAGVRAPFFRFPLESERGDLSSTCSSVVSVRPANRKLSLLLLGGLEVRGGISCLLGDDVFSCLLVFEFPSSPSFPMLSGHLPFLLG